MPTEMPTAEEIAEYQRFKQFQQLSRQAVAPDQPSYPPPPRIAAPRWLKRFGGKLLSLLLIIIVGFKLTYNYFFPTKGDRPASETGGGTYHTYDIFPTSPYEAVRAIYDFIHQRDVLACTRFDDTARAQFVADLGYATCEQAISGLGQQVTDAWAYSFSIPSYGKEAKVPSPIKISSCSYDIQGGPPLGTFILTKVERGQWLITGHEKDPTPCPAQP